MADNKTFNAVIRLRRDNDYNFERIKNTFVPANGEVVLVDTARDGLRAKVGDGFSTFAQLSYTDKDLRDAVIQGYYLDGQFYAAADKSSILPAMMNKVYIDKPLGKLYYFNGESYIDIHDSFPIATSETPGIMKLYNVKGQNIDGTITQKLFTDEVNKKFELAIDQTDSECLNFLIS